MSDKGLDEIFRNKLTNRNFEFNHANWEAMEAMLDADKKPAVYYWWTSAAVVLFGLLTAGIAIFQNPEMGADALPVSVTNDQVEEISLPTIPSNKEELNGFSKEENIASFSNSLPENNSSPESGSVGSGTEGNAQNTNSNLASNHNGGEQISNAIPNNTIASPGAQDESSASIVEQGFQIAFINLIEKPIPSINTSVNSDLSIAPTREYPFRGIRKFQRQQEISMIAGAGIGPSFNGGENSKDWLIGLNYEYRFSFNWSVNAALSYSAKMSPGIIQNSDSIFHSFSPERIITEMENSRLDYIEIPIQFTRSFNSKHQIGLGVYSSVLFNVKTDVKRTSITIKETKKSEFSESGLSENFRQFDYGLTSSYSYQFNPMLSLGVQFKYGLSDITVNNTQELSGYHRNVSSRLVLRYRLF